MTDRDPLARAIEVVIGGLIMVVVGAGLIIRMWAGTGTITRVFERKEKRNETSN